MCQTILSRHKLQVTLSQPSSQVSRWPGDVPGSVRIVVTTCLNLSQLVTTCHNLSQLVTTYHNLSQLVTTSHNLSRLVTTCHNLSRLVTTQQASLDHCVDILQFPEYPGDICSRVSNLQSLQSPESPISRVSNLQSLQSGSSSISDPSLPVQRADLLLQLTDCQMSRD